MAVYFKVKMWRLYLISKYKKKILLDFTVPLRIQKNIRNCPLLKNKTLKYKKRRAQIK